jgi:TRAP-type C4-dicarboxylate transport system permease small subunit
MGWVYGVGYFTSLGIGALVLARLLRLATGRLSEDEINAFAGELSEEAASVRGRAE